MRYNFCTLFDRNYLYKGLALYNSLIKFCPDFKLWILCMDDMTYILLNEMHLPNIELIPLNTIENKKLLNVKRDRNAAEYSWTCKPLFILHILKKHSDLEMITYLDSDLYFYSSPKPIYKEFKNKSIMIIPHRFSLENRHLKKRSGKYNAGILIFRNDKRGLNCLNWWRKKCLEWCFKRYNRGRMGDQMYLNDWPQRFSGIHVLKNKRANVGPWNLSQYKIRKVNNQIFVDDKPLIFYHFHSLEIYADPKSHLHTFLRNISLNNKKLIYNPYLKELGKVMHKIKIINPNFDYGLGPKVPPLKKVILNNNNLIKLYTILWRIPICHKFYKRIKILIHGKRSKN